MATSHLGEGSHAEHRGLVAKAQKAWDSLTEGAERSIYGLFFLTAAAVMLPGCSHNTPKSGSDGGPKAPTAQTIPEQTKKELQGGNNTTHPSSVAEGDSEGNLNTDTAVYRRQPKPGSGSKKVTESAAPAGTPPPAPQANSNPFNQADGSAFHQVQKDAVVYNQAANEANGQTISK